MRGRAVGHWPTIRMHKAVGANGGGKLCHERVAQQYSVFFWAIWWELSLELANSYRPARALQWWVRDRA